MPSADVGIMGWCPRAYSYPTLKLHTPSHTHSPMRCWKSQERIILVACLEARLLVCSWTSYPSLSGGGEVRVNLQGTWRKNQHQQLAGQQLGTCCHRDGGLSLPITLSQLILRVQGRSPFLSSGTKPHSENGRREGRRGKRRRRRRGRRVGMREQTEETGSCEGMGERGLP